MRVEDLKPYADSSASKRAQIAKAFDSIAGGYDHLNRVLSLGLDLSWRRKALRRWAGSPPSDILDVATGTGDFAILAARTFSAARVTGLDLSEGMLAVARRKIEAAGFAGRAAVQRGDALRPPFPDGSFDAVTAAFGVRNFESIPAGLASLLRLLVPGGRVLILELSRPAHFPMKQLHALYLRHWMPFIGRRLTGRGDEYRYLPESVAVVPQGEEMLGLLREAGFTDCAAATYTFGICTAYFAEKPRA